MIIKFYKEEEFDKWDKFVDESLNGTFLHKRKFISYHKNRFIDKSIMIFNDSEKIIAIFPAAVDPSNSTIIISHPGITYGGIITNKIYGEEVVDLMKGICKFYKKQGFEEIIYKAVPYIYHKKYSQDDLYALFRLNSERVRVDLSATVKIKDKIKLRKATKWMLNKGKKSNLTVLEGKEYVDEFWNILTQNLLEKYEQKPVHSIEEIKLLIDKFNEEINCFVCKKDNEVLAGMILFNMENLYHAQYISNSDTAKECGALEYLINFVMEKGISEGKEYFDFGTNNEQQGRYLNQSLYQFKKGFDSGGVVYETYKLNL